jgi:hypothetical protein
MRNDPTYEWWEYGCHEGNTIVQNYSTTDKFERDHPKPEPAQKPVQVSAEVANALAGRWVGKPRVPTVDYNVYLEFSKNADNTVQGKLIGTDLKTFRGRVSPKIDKPLRDLCVVMPGAPAAARAGGAGGGAPSTCIAPGNAVRLNFELPNAQPWTFAGELSADGTTITGTLNSAQGGAPVTFKKG